MIMRSHKQVHIKKGHRTINIPVRDVRSFEKGIGLMFRTRNTTNLLFSFTKDVRTLFTSIFVFFPYLSIWLDKDYRVLDARIIKPFTLRVPTHKPFRYVVEVPVNEANSEILKFFRRKGANV